MSDMKYYDNYSVRNYTIIEEKECFTYGSAPSPFKAYAVKTGEIFDLDGNKTGDIIKWMTQSQYEYLTSYGEKDI